MNGYAGGFVDNDHVVVLVNDADRLSGDGGFVPVEGMRDDVAIHDLVLHGGDLLAIDDDFATLYGVFLKRISYGAITVEDRAGVYVVVEWPVSKLSRKYVKDLSPTPSLLAVGVICVVVWVDFAQPILEVVWSWPWIAWRGDNLWRRHKYIGLLVGGFHGLDNSERHAVRVQATGSPRKICDYSWGGSQRTEWVLTI